MVELNSFLSFGQLRSNGPRLWEIVSKQSELELKQLREHKIPICIQQEFN